MNTEVEAKLGLETQLVGSNFEPGTETNMKIAEAIGRTVVPLNDKDAMFEIRGSEAMTPVKDYCNDLTLSLAELKAIGVQAWLRPTVRLTIEDKQFSRRFVCLFEIDGFVRATYPMKTRANAVACALLNAAQHKSRLTCF